MDSIRTNAPFFSIIVPIYNVDRYLKTCLDSILAQTFTDYEVILVDDGSTDECPELCDQYAHKDPRFVVVHQKNHGLLLARRNGLKLARGQYIIHVDSDDACNTGLLEVLHRTVTKEQADLVIYNFEMIDENDMPFEKKKPVFGKGTEPIALDKESILRYMLTKTDINTIWIKCANRNIVDLDTDYTRYGRLMMGEDVLQSIPLIENAEHIIYISDCLYRYRFNRNGMSRKIAKSYIFDFLNVRRRFYDMRRKGLLSDDMETLLFRNYSHFLINYLVKESLVCKNRKEYMKLDKDIESLLLPIRVEDFLESRAERVMWLLYRSHCYFIIRCIAKIYFQRKINH